jgi:hypothetical protein
MRTPSSTDGTYGDALALMCRYESNRCAIREPDVAALRRTLECVSAYVTARATEPPKVPLLAPARNPHNRATETAASGPRATLSLRKKQCRGAQDRTADLGIMSGIQG